MHPVLFPCRPDSGIGLRAGPLDDVSRSVFSRSASGVKAASGGMSASGAFERCRRTVAMSVYRGRAKVVATRPNLREGPKPEVALAKAKIGKVEINSL